NLFGRNVTLIACAYTPFRTKNKQMEKLILKSKFYLVLGLLALLVCSMSVVAAAQSQSVITGMVSDSEGQPISGVTVAVRGGSASVHTDSEGQFRISVPNTRATLPFTSLGYLTLDYPLAG